MARAIRTMILLLAFGNAIQASPIGIDLTATVTAVNDPSNCLGGAIRVGDMITAKYVYDSATPNSEPQIVNTGEYDYSSTPYGLVVRAGGLTFQTNPSAVNFGVEVIDGTMYSSNATYNVFSSENLPYEGYSWIHWQIDDPTGAALASIDLPSGPPDLASWSYNALFVQWLGGPDPSAAQFSFEAVVVSATLAADPYDPLLPEPGTLSLVGLGLVAVRIRRWCLLGRTDGNR